MLTELAPGLLIGNQEDYECEKNHEDWAYVLAGKHPWHRQALGYTGNAAPKYSDEYLVALRENRCILNLIDADSAEWIPETVINSAVSFIHENRRIGRPTMVACNQGVSRSPSLALLYLRTYDPDALQGNLTLEAAMAWLRQGHPTYQPKNGMIEAMRRGWPLTPTISSS